MSVLTAALHEAIATAWTDADMDTLFGTSPSLHDGMAMPGQSFPYAVFEASPSIVNSRMSGHAVNENHAIVDVPLNFRVYAAQTQSSTAKQEAARLAEEVMKVFGGHPTDPPNALTLDEGAGHLITQYVADYGMREDDDVHVWIVSYLFRLDTYYRVS